MFMWDPYITPYLVPNNDVIKESEVRLKNPQWHPCLGCDLSYHFSVDLVKTFIHINRCSCYLSTVGKGFFDFYGKSIPCVLGTFTWYPSIYGVIVPLCYPFFKAGNSIRAPFPKEEKAL